MSHIRTFALVLSFAILPAAGLVGCKDGGMKHDSSMSKMDSDQMSKSDMMSHGDDMVMKGQKMKDDAMKMSSGEMMNGMSKEDMMMKGDQMMSDGKMMKEKAMKM